MTSLIVFDIINYTKNLESFMKNISLAKGSQIQQIRDNRSRIRQNLKINLIQHEKRTIQNEITPKEENHENKTESHVKILNRIGLVQKQYIQGQFSDAYDLKQKIGEGAHASVYRCIQKETGKKFAVKVTKHGDQELIESSKLQFKILKNLDHENVMKAQAFYTDRVKMTTYLVCELCSYPELGIHLRNRNRKSLSQSQATTIIASILQTLQYLHKKGVCHRDIKPQNILYDPESKKIKIIDFDCATTKKQNNSKFQMWTKTGSLHYQAPQYFKSTIYDEKVDLWAAGIIAYQMVAGFIPFKSSYYSRMIKMITEDQIQIEGLNVSNDYKLFLKKILEKNPLKRYTASECLRLPVLLKGQHVHTIKMFDDFNIQLSTSDEASPKPLKNNVRCSQTSTCGKDSPLPLLKYFCFVQQL